MSLPESYFQEQPEYVVGKLVEIRLDDSEYGQRIVVEVLPVGESIPRPLFFSSATANSRRGKWQRFLKGLRAIGVDTTSADTLVGAVVQFQLVERTAQFEDRDVTYDVWKPLQVYGSEAEAIADLADVIETQTTARDAGSVAVPSEEQLKNARTVWESLGKDEAQFLAVATISWPDIPGEQLLDAVKS